MQILHKLPITEKRTIKNIYQKITDIYATAVDYHKNAKTTRDFYAMVQNKMHYAVHGNTAAEIIISRADHKKTKKKEKFAEQD